jgi:hypothetical protein
MIFSFQGKKTYINSMHYLICSVVTYRDFVQKKHFWYANGDGHGHVQSQTKRNMEPI